MIAFIFRQFPSTVVEHIYFLKTDTKSVKMYRE